jgi:hypothetical protein
LHVLPTGFVRIRCFGLLANRHRNPALNLCRKYLRESLPLEINPTQGNAGVAKLCQHCRRGIMRLVEVLSPSATCHLVARPTASSILPIPFPPRPASFKHPHPTRHSKHIISAGAASFNPLYRQCSHSHCCPAPPRPERWR